LTSDDKKVIRVVLKIVVSWPERQYRRVQKAQRITGE
jgi:hypothetical protein